MICSNDAGSRCTGLSLCYSSVRAIPRTDCLRAGGAILPRCAWHSPRAVAVRVHRERRQRQQQFVLDRPPPDSSGHPRPATARNPGGRPASSRSCLIRPSRRSTIERILKHLQRALAVQCQRSLRAHIDEADAAAVAPEIQFVRHLAASVRQRLAQALQRSDRQRSLETNAAPRPCAQRRRTLAVSRT